MIRHHNWQFNTDSILGNIYACLFTAKKLTQTNEHFMLNAFVIIIITDPRGVQTVTRAWQAGGADITETASAGVTNRVTRYFGGATINERFWDGNWTRETRSESFNAQGCRVETVVTESSDYPVFTNSVTFYDFLGRVESVLTPAFGGGWITAANFYDGSSTRVVRSTSTGTPDTLYEYDGLGNLRDTAVDVNDNGVIDYSGQDRISRSETSYTQSGFDWWRETASCVWSITNSAQCLTNSLSRMRMTGLGAVASGQSGIPDGAILTAQIERVDWRGNVTRVSTYVDAGLAAVWIVTETPGSAQPAMRKSVAGHPVSAVSSSSVTNSYTFDGFGRQVSATDGRGNTTLISHNELGQVACIEDAATNRTTYTYDELGRQVAVSSPLSNTVFTAYDSLGNVIRTWGATYPVEYGYDTRNLRVSMKTFRDENGDGDETRWLYDGATGLLTNKVYADGKGTAYGYTTSGRLDSRVWARGVTTDYSYDTLGQLIGIEYSDSTPDVTFAYDRIGNVVSVSDASGTRVFAHALDGQTISDTLFAMGRDFKLLESRDDFGRDTGYSFSNTVNGVTSHIAGMCNSYDPFGRILQVRVDGVPSTFRYEYRSGTDLQQSLFMPNGVTRQTVYEPNRDLSASITHTNSSGNILARRTFIRDASENLIGRTQYRLGENTNRVDVFSHNARGELVYAALGTNSFAYNFDPIGNRLTTDEPGFSAVYLVNSLNQYTHISNSVPPSQFVPEFDADGNPTLLKAATGIWHVTYNAENRPVIFSNETAVIEMGYDYMGRRFEYKETGGGAVTRHERHLYRGYLRLAALDLLGETNVLHAIAWDPSEPVATRPLALQTQSGWFAFSFDQVKNVTELFDESGNIVAAYDYAPFGAVAESSGPAVSINPLTFSSEIADSALGLQYYIFRHLNTLDGVWIGRDPVEEMGGLNLYVICGNNTFNIFDLYGLVEMKTVTWIRVRYEEGKFSVISGNPLDWIKIKWKIIRNTKAAYDIYSRYSDAQLTLVDSDELFTQEVPECYELKEIRKGNPEFDAVYFSKGDGFSLIEVRIRFKTLDAHIYGPPYNTYL